MRLAAVFPLCSLPLLLAPVDRWRWRRWRWSPGLCLAPYMAAANQLVGDVAPAGAVTEAFAWPITAHRPRRRRRQRGGRRLAQTWGWRPGFGAWWRRAG